MIRWNHFNPKIIGAITIACCMAWAVGPLVQHYLTRACLENLGVKLSIDETSVSIFSSELEFTDVQLTHPSDSQDPLFECQRVKVDVEGIPVLRRKLVIRNATVYGLRLPTKPIASEELTRHPSLPSHWKLQLPAQKLLQSSLSKVAASSQHDPLADSGTLALLDVLSANSEQEALELQNELGIYELRLERLAEITEELAQPSLEAIDVASEQTADQTLAEIRDLEKSVYEFRKQIDASRKKFLSDRERLQSLKEQDLSPARTAVDLQLPNSQVLSEYFLGAAASQRSWEVLRFVEWARGFLPQEGSPGTTKGASGLTIAYPERHPLPAFVLRALHFEGQGELADRTFHFAGTLQNLTNDPQGFPQPTRLVIDAKVPHRVVVDASIDRTGAVPTERIVVRCPSWPQRQQVFGNSDQVGISAKPCLLSLRAELNMTGKNVSGIVQMRQQRLNLSPQVPGALGGKRVHAALAEMLSQIETIDYDVKLNGPVDSPGMELKSAWGERVAGGLQHAFASELSRRSAELHQRLERDLDTRIAKWEASASLAQQELQDRLGTTLEQVQLLDSLVQQNLPRTTQPGVNVTQRPESLPETSVERK